MTGHDALHRFRMPVVALLTEATLPVLHAGFRDYRTKPDASCDGAAAIPPESQSFAEHLQNSVCATKSFEHALCAPNATPASHRAMVLIAAPAIVRNVFDEC
jgi:hypothetical protein